MKFMKKTSSAALISPDHLARQIYVIRGQKVMLDADLAVMYGVLTKNLNKAAQRNIERFPPDFMFKLTNLVPNGLRSRNKCGMTK